MLASEVNKVDAIKSRKRFNASLRDNKIVSNTLNETTVSFCYYITPVFFKFISQLDTMSYSFCSKTAQRHLLMIYKNF